MHKNEQPKSIIVIFGATGDLAKRKLYPSLFHLFQKGHISEQFAVVGIGRREWSDETLRTQVRDSIKNEIEGEHTKLEEFCNQFYYKALNVTSKQSYTELKTLLDQLDSRYHIGGNRVFYMAMAPEFFGTIASYLKSEQLTDTEGWTRLVIEKPFGHDLESAETLNTEIREAFREDEIYRIDHYLGKEMVQNIQVIRFANAVFEPLWNNQHIANVQITSSERLGVEDRGGYYENSGALRDMVQNHLLQMVTLLAMDPPLRLTTEEIRSEKIKVLRALRPIVEQKVKDSFVRAQYGQGVYDGEKVQGYLKEKNVAPDSKTETFVAGKLLIDNYRWAGVPFYIRTGKRMAAKSTKIVIEFKPQPHNLYLNNGDDPGANLLVIHIQPDEGMSLMLNGKKIGTTGDTSSVNLHYSQHGIDGINTPEAYERLLFDCMIGDATNFAHWDEVNLSWTYIDAISEAWEGDKDSLPSYSSGSMGPKEAEDLLLKDGFHWWPIEKM
ncbi:glucose-6-phosphate dehydrogenase [Alkalicoccobacillus porphyridii]|uniref:Glucose-6-phosphate 1-dehydrogenase n=1 Tax=Alkalicoccobacillus porphyridii TaxID=2597270 RepID=A0A554A085_9BACI|nr:glucose-6-phosphate dehydrogenase [Alkalicoccobacillus porphyridii]TSB47098.1 glucose-6-phosphate dehydrogenase [Alkalicoccobacillus porphyridii]